MLVHHEQHSNFKVLLSHNNDIRGADTMESSLRLPENLILAWKLTQDFRIWKNLKHKETL